VNSEAAFLSHKLGVKQGTKTRPHLVYVNVDAPDDNREFIIFRCQGLRNKTESVTHRGFAISMVIHPPDAERWEAKVVSVPGFEQRAVLIKGPSGGFFTRHEKMLRDYNFDQPEAVKMAVMAHDVKMKDDEDRVFEYWLCLFPRDCKLDVTLLESDGKADVLNVEPAGLEYDKCELLSNRLLIGVRLTWCIAETEGALRIAPEVAKPRKINWNTKAED
jgi:hypothetical protein